MNATPGGDGDGTLAGVELTESDGYIVATDTDTGVASQGETKAEALANLAEALELHERPVPEDAEEPDPSTAPWM